jgi:hypothetical protein
MALWYCISRFIFLIATFGWRGIFMGLLSVVTLPFIWLALRLVLEVALAVFAIRSSLQGNNTSVFMSSTKQSSSTDHQQQYPQATDGYQV